VALAFGLVVGLAAFFAGPAVAGLAAGLGGAAGALLLLFGLGWWTAPAPEPAAVMPGAVGADRPPTS
jgi:hypothetical protein